MTRLLFGLEYAVVFADERLDLRSAGKNAKPLFFVEGVFDLVELLPRLNVNGDAELNRLP